MKRETLDQFEQQAIAMELFARQQQQQTTDRHERQLADTLLRHAVGAMGVLKKWKQTASQTQPARA